MAKLLTDVKKLKDQKVKANLIASEIKKQLKLGKYKRYAK